MAACGTVDTGEGTPTFDDELGGIVRSTRKTADFASVEVELAGDRVIAIRGLRRVPRTPHVTADLGDLNFRRADIGERAPATSKMKGSQQANAGPA